MMERWIGPGYLWPEKETAAVSKTQAGSPGEPARTRRSVGLTEATALAAILALTAALDFWHLDQNGYGNAYYAAAVRSMLVNGHNLFYVAFDPAGFLAVDKPPLGLWAQVAAAKLFGYSSASLLLPQALAGVLAVLVLYLTVRHDAGILAGLLAAGSLAITPINVVSNRDNTVDSVLVLMVLVGAWALLRAASSGSLLWLLVGFAGIGLGFNIKMLEAYLVLPAFVLTYALTSSVGRRRRTMHLALAVVLLLVVSLSWVIAVDVTPAAQRPYVGSTATDSELELAFGYNGLSRLFGASTGSSQAPRLVVATRLAAAPKAPVDSAATLPPGSGRKDIGPSGPFRLVTPPLALQVGWFLPLAVMGLVALLATLIQRAPADGDGYWTSETRSRMRHGVVFWGTWAVVVAAFFSVARVYNVYYLVMLTPAICALAGIGQPILWREYVGASWRGWLLPAAILLCAVVQATSLATWPQIGATLAGAALVAGVAIALALAIGRAATVPARRAGELLAGQPRVPVLALAATSALALAISPFAWSAASLTNGNAGGGPISGPMYADATPAPLPWIDPRMVGYLSAHRGSATYLVATVDAVTASPFIIRLGQPVMALGGFGGWDHILSPSDLSNLIEDGTVRFFLLPSSNLSAAQVHDLYPHFTGAYTPTYTNSLTEWIATNCAPVTPRDWNLYASTSRIWSRQIFDCAVVARSSPQSWNTPAIPRG